MSGSPSNSAIRWKSDTRSLEQEHVALHRDFQVLPFAETERALLLTHFGIYESMPTTIPYDMSCPVGKNYHRRLVDDELGPHEITSD